MFYSPPTVGDKPRAKIFILPKRFKIEKSTFEVIKDLDWTGGTCDTLKDGQPDDSMDQYCYTLVRLFYLLQSPNQNNRDNNWVLSHHGSQGLVPGSLGFVLRSLGLIDSP